MDAATLCAATRQHRAGKGGGQRQHQQRVTHGHSSGAVLPSLQRACHGVFLGGAAFGLIRHVVGLRANHAVRQHKRLVVSACPTRLQGALHAPLGRFVLQIHPQHIAVERVNLHAHTQQFAAQVGTVAAQHRHWHCPRRPAPKRGFDAQQSAVVAAVGIGGDGV